MEEAGAVVEENLERWRVFFGNNTWLPIAFFFEGGKF